MRIRASIGLSLPLLLIASAPAQDDMRDVVTRTDGKVVTGRVAIPTAADELLVLQGGRRVRIARKEIAAIDLVADRVREFCRRRIAHKDNERAQWFLVDWAESRGLPGLARAQAMLLALDHDHEGAHEFLGHRKAGKEWLWKYDGRDVAPGKLAELIGKKGIEIAGERFVVRCNDGLRANVAALLDLEQLGATFYQRFGAALQLEETLRPMTIEVARNGNEFDKWGFRPAPYYVPPPHGDEGRTFYAGVAPTRPEKLFFVGTQALLYRSLIGEVDQRSDRDRVCAWLEVGLGMLMENTMQGAAGYAFAGDLQLPQRTALTALGRSFRLGSLLHLPMYGGFYLMDDTPTAIHWASATMLVAWLLDDDNKPATREPFLDYVRQALGDKKGDSSSLFDQVMGRRIEEMDEPWVKWLEKKAGY
ncbi:MAG: hypothetical protein KDC98_10630 [Planctomycetes bacterium]|nr:hypothetical protein [Planctomycetota bacterium]